MGVGELHLISEYSDIRVCLLTLTLGHECQGLGTFFKGIVSRDFTKCVGVFECNIISKTIHTNQENCFHYQTVETCSTVSQNYGI